jgi:hypothetical protein
MTRYKMPGSHGIMAGTLPRQMEMVLSVDPQHCIVVMPGSWSVICTRQQAHIYTTCGTLSYFKLTLSFARHLLQSFNLAVDSCRTTKVALLSFLSTPPS